MLVNLLNQQGYTASLVAADTLAGERVDKISALNADLVVVSSMPPAARSIHARYLCKLIRTKYPEIQMLVAVWSVEGRIERLKKHLSADSRIKLVTEFHEAATDAMHQLSQPLPHPAREEQPAPAAQTASSN